VHHAPDHHGGQDRHAQQAHAAEPVRLVLEHAGSASDGEPTLDEVIPGPSVHDPVNQVISSEELRSLVACLSTALSDLESRVLALYLDGYSYEQVGDRIGCDCKTVDNALQRVKRKVGAHLAARNVML
jgi:RNA polymerase sporulation-specific sigma factor